MTKIYNLLFNPTKDCYVAITDYNEFNDKLDLSRQNLENVSITVNTVEDAIKYYEIFNNVTLAKSIHEDISSGYSSFSLGLFGFSKTKQDLVTSINQVSEFKGIILFRYDHLYDETNIMFNELKTVGIEPLLNIQEDNKKYLIAKRVPSLLSTNSEFEDFGNVFSLPIVDIDALDTESVKKYKPFGGSYSYWYENKFSDWKLSFFTDKAKSRKKLLSQIRKEKYMGGTIKAPNKEQAAIAIASGRFDRQVTLEDGRTFIFKGTERIIEEEKIKLSLLGEPKAVRHIYKRKAEVVGFDMTNGEFVRFT